MIPHALLVVVVLRTLFALVVIIPSSHLMLVDRYASAVGAADARADGRRIMADAGGGILRDEDEVVPGISRDRM